MPAWLQRAAVTGLCVLYLHVFVWTCMSWVNGDEQRGNRLVWRTWVCFPRGGSPSKIREIWKLLSSLAVLPRKNWAWPDRVHTASFPVSSRRKIAFLSPLPQGVCTISPVLENTHALLIQYIYINRRWSCYLRELSSSVLCPFRRCLFSFPASFGGKAVNSRAFLVVHGGFCEASLTSVTNTKILS